VLITLNNKTLRLRSPMVTAHGTTTDRHIIEITAEEDGFFGYGEAAPLPSFGAETFEETHIALTEWSKNPDSLPDPPVARSGAAAALDYLQQSKLRTPLPPGAVAVQALIGALEISSVERQISDAIDDGYRAVKLKVAATDTASDVERIELAIRLIDSRVLLRLDANGGWTEQQALAVLTRVDASRIALVEEPTSVPSDWGKIKRETGIAVGADEHLTDRQQIDRLIELEAAQTFVLKPSILGGPPATRSIAALAATNDIEIVISSFLDGPIALRTARDLALELAPEQIHGLGTAPLFEDEFPQDVQPVDGHLHRR